MTDDFDFKALAKSWQQQQTPKEHAPSVDDLAQASKRQRRQRTLMYGEWLGALVMAMAACWIVFTIPGWLGGVSCAFLVFGALSTFYISWQVHRPILAYDNWSCDGLVQFRYRACQLSVQYLRYTQCSCIALMVFSGVLWLLHWLQLDHATEQLLGFYTFIVSPLCLLAIYKLQQKIRQKTAELGHLKVLVADFEHSAQN